VINGVAMKQLTRKQTRSSTLEPDTDLGLAVLIAEDEEGHYEPVAVVGTINEATEIARDDMASRMRRLERDDDPGICPGRYMLWVRGVDGYRPAHEIVL